MTSSGNRDPRTPFLVVALAALALDQLTKALVIHTMSQNQSFSLGILDIRHVHNYGAAFGMMQNAGVLFIVIAVIVLAIVFIFWPRISRAEPFVIVSLALITGGTVGNLIDRLRFGYVVDFIDLRWWPVFNVADSCICVGVGLLVWKICQQTHNDASTGISHSTARGDTNE